MRTPIQLGVNIDHIATIRQARGTLYPDPVQAGFVAVDAGADSITVHLREDRRHIQERDVRILRDSLTVPLNLEMAATPAMLKFARDIKPQKCCLVPEKRQELTTEGGLDVSANRSRLETDCGELLECGIEVSLFIDPDAKQISAASNIGVKVVELHTGAYADAQTPASQREALRALSESATQAAAQRLQVNAGHGLTYQNVVAVAAIPEIVELNIGHAIVARALFDGFASAVREMKRIIQQGRR